VEEELAALCGGADGNQRHAQLRRQDQADNDETDRDNK
jgi:hypothetical protein